MSRARNLGNLGNKNLITGDPNTTRVGIGSTNPVSTLNVAGIVSATSYYGDGSNLEGVATGGGLGTAFSDDDTAGALTQIFTTTRQDIVAAGTSATIDASGAGGGIAFTKLNRIDVGTGATFHVGAGTTLIMNVLNVF